MVCYLIHTSTLKSIIDAIEETGKSESMPTLYINDGEDKHFILHETLVDIADQVRLATGKTGKIPVTELANQILSAFSEDDTTSILGVAVLGKAILGRGV